MSKQERALELAREGVAKGWERADKLLRDLGECGSSISKGKAEELGEVLSGIRAGEAIIEALSGRCED